MAKSEQDFVVEDSRKRDEGEWWPWEPQKSFCTEILGPSMGRGTKIMPALREQEPWGWGAEVPASGEQGAHQRPCLFEGDLKTKH